MPAPVIGRDGTIYVGSANGFLYALNPDSSVKWNFRIRTRSNQSGIAGTSCVLDEDGAVYFVSSVPDFAGRPVLDLIRDYFSQDQLYSLNPDGTKKFSSTGSGLFWTPVIGPGSTIYDVGQGLRGWIGLLSAFAPDGSAKSDIRFESPRMSLSISSPPAVGSDGTLYAGASTGNLYFLVATDSAGNVTWTFQDPFGPIYCPPTLGTNKVIYFGCNDKKLYAVAASSGPGTAPWPMYRGNARHTGSLPAPALDHASLGIGMYAGLVIHGNLGSTFRIEAQDRITGAWSAVGTITLDRTPYLFFDLGSPNASKRFYRAILLSQ